MSYVYVTYFKEHFCFETKEILLNKYMVVCVYTYVNENKVTYMYFKDLTCLCLCLAQTHNIEFIKFER